MVLAPNNFCIFGKVKKCLALILLFVCVQLNAQTDSVLAAVLTKEEQPIKTPFNPKGNYHTLALSFFPFVWILGNGGGIFLSAAVDYSLFKNQSIGISASAYGDENGHDGYSGPNGPNHPDESYNGANKYLYANYRYYFNGKETRENTGLVFYLGIFGRLGMANYGWTPGYDPSGITSAKQTSYAYGGLAGVSLKLKHLKHFGLDFNVGTLYNNKTYTQTYVLAPTTTIQYSSYDLRVTGSLCWFFYIDKKSKQP